MIRLRPIARIRRSLFLKIILVFLAAVFAVPMYFFLQSLVWGNDRDWASIQAIAVNYASYVVDEVGLPPDAETAAAVSNRLGVQIRIAGPGIDWASSEKIPDFDAADLHDYRPVSGTSPVQGVRAGIDDHLGLAAELRRGEYRFLVGLQPGNRIFDSRPWGAELLDILFMVGLLVGLYWSIRWLLSPVRALNEGVERLRKGDEGDGIKTTRTDELGRLILSFNDMATAVRDRIRARDQLLLDVSHEIRSPLTRMRVALEMIPESAGRDSVLDDIEQTEHMIAELLETERLASPHGGLTRTRTDVTEVLRSSVRVRLEEGADVVLEGARSPLWATADPERIRVVFNNVITNAVKHSAGSGEPVRVLAGSEPGYVFVNVLDHGPGIPSQDLPFVLEPFFKSDRSRSKEGYGLGLSLASRIMEAHGGSIVVESEEDVGTTVRLRIPTGPMEISH